MINLILVLAISSVGASFFITGMLRKAAEEAPLVKGKKLIYAYPARLKYISFFLLIMNSFLLFFLAYTMFDALLLIIILVMFCISVYSFLDYFNSRLVVEQGTGNGWNYEFRNVIGKTIFFTSEDIDDIKSDGKKSLLIIAGNNEIPFKYGWAGRKHFLEQIR